ncbi:MAG: sugar phosphate isomerase/epimerase [Ruminococcaceae bacterium]|nr:sugar phosphate isomerase/epimerase [Oscillospiraceae bacterium]
MRYGTGAWMFGRFGEDRYKKLKESGFDCVDYPLADTDGEFYTATDERRHAMIAHEKALAAESGVSFHQVHGPWRWPAQDGTEEERAERMEKMKRSLQFTAELGCKNWVIHPIMPFGVNEKDDPELAAKTWDINRVFMSELLALAKSYDITICFENMPMPAFSLGDPAAILKFVQEMNDDHFMICLDTGHAEVCPDFTAGSAARLMGKYVRVLHVHDNDGQHDWHQLPFFGVTDWQDFGVALKEIGYDGVFNFETNPPWKMPTPLFVETAQTMAKMGRTIMGEV